MLDTIITILLTILIFGAIIFIHEFGHFIVCRITGVKVLEFAMGMGPTILKHQGKRTLYSLRLFPIGGFCSMEGEDAAGGGAIAKDPDDEEDGGGDDAARLELEGDEGWRHVGGEASGGPRGNEEAAAHMEGTEAAEAPKGRREAPFYEKSIPARIAICAAGAFMNVLLGFAIMLGITATQSQYLTARIAEFRENGPAGMAQLQIDDEILKVDGSTVFSPNDIPVLLQLSKTGVVDLVVRRDGERITLEGVDFTVTDENGDTGIALGFLVYPEKPSFFGAFGYAAKETISTARNSWLSIGGLFTGKLGFKDLSGPVGVGQVVGQAAKIGLSSLLSLAAFISISIGMFNLLPFPALDGGRIVFLLIEAIRRKPINPKWEGYVNAAGLILLFGLMIVVTFKDILNLF